MTTGHPGWRHAQLYNVQAPGTAVLALHGFTGSGADWAPIAAELNAPMVAVDLLGHGASAAPQSAEAYRMPRVVDHCLDHCASRKRWVVMGYSMGGRVALRVASRLGDRLAGLVLISASPGLSDAAARADRALADRALADAIEANGVPWFAERWSEHPLIRSQRDIPDAIRSPMQQRRHANRAHGLAGSLRGMGQGATRPCWHVLPNLTAPTLWMTGDDDPRYTDIAGRAVTRMPNARHVRIAGAGHCTHLEAIGPAVTVMGGFVDEVRHDGLQADTAHDVESLG